MNKQTKWLKEHRGVHYEIVFWGEGVMNEGAGMWNYYIVIPEDQLSPEDWQKVWLEPIRYMERSAGFSEPIYDVGDSILAHGDFHGGITFYEKIVAVDTDPLQSSIRVGCDYVHSFDREYGYPYDLDRITSDAQKTIDNLHKVLTFKRRCDWTGKYFLEEEGIWDSTSEKLLSPEGWQAKKKWYKSRDDE